MLALGKIRARGFTLVELLVAVAILGIVLAMGLPEFKTWMVNVRIRTITESLNAGLQMARAEAVRRNDKVRFVVSSTGWTINVDSSGTQIQASDENRGNVTVTATPSGATTITFNSLGRTTTNADASAALTQLDIDVPTSVLAASKSNELRLTLSTGGQIKMCDPSKASPDPRAC